VQLEVQSAGKLPHHPLVAVRGPRDAISLDLLGRLGLLDDGFHARFVDARGVEPFEIFRLRLPRTDDDGVHAPELISQVTPRRATADLRRISSSLLDLLAAPPPRSVRIHEMSSKMRPIKFNGIVRR
jgi:hypothetical protein